MHGSIYSPTDKNSRKTLGKHLRRSVHLDICIYNGGATHFIILLQPDIDIYQFIKKEGPEVFNQRDVWTCRDCNWWVVTWRTVF